ncbi:conjugative transposon protein TraM [Confluentibacter flavum]|uniref:Conjugal transfer protein TraM n=1 Tax=Confluentibacter flavum TaxID=1909700 RepID=A0A2N3HGY5_9FLAO|nr:conjugative transposon protein TraM [Confluentibacter flavum]PKQ44235.1 conjugal transfer protein TraM [Confluentibacter flavum]
MKIEKNKIVFAATLLCVVLFIVAYAMLIMGSDDNPSIENNQIPLPKLEEGQKTYESKLDALNDLKEVRQTNAPSIYDDRLLDSTGVYDPDLMDQEKMRMIDSIYNEGRIQYSENTLKNNIAEVPIEDFKPQADTIVLNMKAVTSTKELGLEHQLFFASNPKASYIDKFQNSDPSISVIVDGTQTVKANYRLSMRLMEDAIINGINIPRNTPIYGFVSFRPNRTIINIENINHQPVKLKAFDLQDGSEGIYIENSFREDATREVVDDVVQDINIAGIPQVGGVKKLFQRDNRTIKVTVLNNYQLILKAQ